MQPQQDQNYWQPAVQDDPIAYREPDTSEVAESLPSTDTSPITWQASEFVHHDKGAEWFLGLFGVAILLLMIDVLVIHSWTFGALIVVMAVSATIVARRPPRLLNYSLSLQGVKIDEKAFSFHDFRAFGVVPEGAFYSIRLVPAKRFMPMVSIYFPPEQGESIVDLLGSVLPMEQIELDPIDKFVEKIRF